MSKPTLSPRELSELENQDTVDPFLKLGYHHVAPEGKTQGVIRVYNPLFGQVDILFDGGERRCEAVSGNGLFEALFPDRLEFFPYRIRAKTVDGHTLEYVDPYSILPVLSDFDLYLFARGTHYRIWEKLGANVLKHQDHDGVHFSVWAPNARGVSVIGDFNAWNGRAHLLRRLSDSGVWEIFIPGLTPGHKYKFLIHTASGTRIEKLDPYAKETELRPKTAGIISDTPRHVWRDGEWIRRRPEAQKPEAPLSIYEVHLGSWKRGSDPETYGFMSYRHLADELIPYVKGLGYTHIECLPLQEHPLDESWGYQVIGYYAPTKRFGSPDDLRYFIDRCHEAGLGVILDWVPAHFPSDAHGLDHFDGTQLYAHEDPRRGEHPQWGTRIFNYSRHEVSNFLVANALYWIEEFHLDGLRVDAVASMLYLDYAREPGQWLPNPDGGNINHEAVEFLKHLNSLVHEKHPGCLVIAEESSAFPRITHGLDRDGIGFDYKWSLGWMNDFLSYMSKDPIYRRYHQGLLTFEMSYAFSEKFMLVLSHDEVVHGKKSLLNKMPGDDWQKFANCRLAFCYLYAHPGKKLHFMGMEFGQWIEWNAGTSLDWHLTEWDRHQALRRLVQDLNGIYRKEPCFWELDTSWEGFYWIDFQDADGNVISFARRGRNPGSDTLLCVFNFSPLARHNYRVGAPLEGFWEEVFNSDAGLYGGGNIGNMGGHRTDSFGAQGQPYSLDLTLPPLAAVFLKRKS